MSVSVALDSGFLITAACFAIVLVVAVGFALWLPDEDDKHENTEKEEVPEK